MADPQECLTLSEFAVRFCSSCGTLLISKLLFGEERPTCPSCGWIYFADPKVAAAVVVEQDGQVLLVRRINEPYRGYWSLPAGFVNAQEDPALAAVRECLEETGLQVEVTGLMDVIAGREHSRGADIIIVYRARLMGGVLKAGDDADLASFFQYDNLPPLAFRATIKVLSSR
jgi:8-oxo-dGTP diphosphatase